MKHMKKLWALLLALGVTAAATESVEVTDPSQKPAGNEPTTATAEFTIVKKVVKDEKAATPPAETFEFVLEDTASEKKSPTVYGITLDELKIATDGVKEYPKTIEAKIDMSKAIGDTSVWEKIIPVGSKTVSAYYKTFHITEKNSGKDGWDYSTAKYDVTFKYDCDDNRMTCGVYEVGNDVSFRAAEFTNTYTKQADPTTTVTIPFTKEVKLGGNTAPDKQTFELEIFNSVNPTDGLTITSAVETNGSGTYESKLVITGSGEKVDNLIGRGFYVREKIGNAANWTYSDAVWHVIKVDGQNKIYPATKKTSDNGDYYEDGAAVEKMTFTNTYTRNTSSTVYPTQPTKPTSSPKTFDAGIGLYAVSALLSVTGSAWLVGKKHK